MLSFDRLFQAKSSIIALRNEDKYTKKTTIKINTFDSISETLEIDTDGFSIKGSLSFASGKKRRKSRINLPIKTSTFCTTKRMVDCTSTKIGQKKVFALV